MSPEWLFTLTHRSGLTRLFSLLTGVSILILGDGLLLVRLARNTGIYLALAIEGMTTIAAAIVVGSTVNSYIKKIRADVWRGTYDPKPYMRLAAVVTAMVLLFIPGFVTDIVGMVLYIPPGRTLFGAYFFRRNRDTIAQVYEHLTIELFSTAEQAQNDGQPGATVRKDEAVSK